MTETDIKQLIKVIHEASGVSEAEIEEKMNAKIEELGGLIGEMGAAHLIAKELGVTLQSATPDAQSSLKIESIFSGMKNVDITGKVMQIFNVREFKKKDGGKGKVGSVVIGDDTGKVRVVFWDGDVQKLEELEEGDILKIKGAYSKENLNSEPELHIGMRTRIIVNPNGVNPEDFPDIENRRMKISQLSHGMQDVDIVCKVLRIFGLREFERSDGNTGKVVNLLVSDETGVARVTLWDENTDIVDGIKEGDILEVTRGYVKVRNEMADVNVGRYSTVNINPSGITLDNAIESSYSAATKKSLAEANDGEVIMVRGALVDISEEPKIFDRDSGKGVVINAIIDDGTANMRTAFYDALAETLLDMPTQLLVGGDYHEKLEERRKKLLGKEVVVTAKVKTSDFTGKLELVARDLNLNPDPREEIKTLLEEARKGENYGA
ncbi:MAG TPA: hypothetical protein ENH28_03300 [Euryarchaeota archaeon]|nr:replication factor A [archaeon BMS3Bbin15]HDL15168.1 hypothetical protein [Euryarchaeota archaeon]